MVSELSVLAIILLFYSMKHCQIGCHGIEFYVFIHMQPQSMIVDHENPIDVAAELSSDTNNLDPG